MPVSELHDWLAVIEYRNNPKAWKEDTEEVQDWRAVYRDMQIRTARMNAAMKNKPD
jgi:hypothetical protein